MYLALLVIILLGALFAPQWWARRVMQRHSAPRTDYPGTGAELARHLLDKFELNAVRVEIAEQGDHYDPTAKIVRLSAEHFNGKSLTAIAVAAHEVGHAIQDALDYAPLRWRSQLVSAAQQAERFGSGMIVLMPVITLLARSPRAAMVMFVLGLAGMALSVLVHLVTLPVELDASFNRALPLLQAGQYLDEQDQVAAQQVLRAAALTYLAASLASLLNVWRWMSLWRGRG
ncbi:MAG: zinc metallopeptidase [Gammaproteobacteria bacterium]|nr:zinc metallopeptidase [Gammaproteobacteria bacterium]